MYSIQILARSYAVRYRECSANETLVWQFKPIKKSINWAIWRRIDRDATQTTKATKPGPNGPVFPTPKRRNSRQPRHLPKLKTGEGESQLPQPQATGNEERKFNLKEKLESVGMEEVVGGGRCEGGQIQKGTFNVSKGGMYALVLGT